MGGEGIGFHHALSMLIYNMILVRIVFLQILRRAFPDAAGQPFQGLRLGIPFVEIADQGHGLRVGRPHPENISILPGGMAPEHLIGRGCSVPGKMPTRPVDLRLMPARGLLYMSIPPWWIGGRTIPGGAAGNIRSSPTGFIQHVRLSSDWK